MTQIGEFILYFKSEQYETSLFQNKNTIRMIQKAIDW